MAFGDEVSDEEKCYASIFFFFVAFFRPTIILRNGYVFYRQNFCHVLYGTLVQNQIQVPLKVLRSSLNNDNANAPTNKFGTDSNVTKYKESCNR
jgi:hypothetical protein